MPISLKDLFDQADYIVMVSSGLTFTAQEYDEGEGIIDLEYDDGAHYKSLPETTLVEPLIDGNILLDGVEFRAYVAQQVKFEPTSE